MQSDATNDLSAALAKAQAAMKPATFNRINPHFKNRYADLAAVLASTGSDLPIFRRPDAGSAGRVADQLDAHASIPGR